MDYRVSGRDVSINVKFAVDGDYVTPDAASVRYWLYDNDDVADPVYTNVAPSVAAGATSVTLKFVAASNTLGVGIKSSRRLLLVNFTYNTQPFTIEIPYTIVPGVPTACSAKDVRDVLGATEVEVPDSIISLREAYWAVADDIDSETGEDDLNESLTAGGRETTMANRAIVLKAALAIVPTMALRVTVSEEGEGKSFTRQRVDWNAVGARLSSEYTKALGIVNPVVEETPSLLVLSTEGDPVTGV
jgi:hypothetical protein